MSSPATSAASGRRGGRVMVGSKQELPVAVSDADHTRQQTPTLMRRPFHSGRSAEHVSVHTVNNLLDTLERIGT